MTKLGVIALVSCMIASGCCKKSETEGDTSPASAGTTGLADPTNNKAVVALAKEALACKWMTSGFDPSCAAFKAWNESELLKGGAADPTLVNFVDDGDEKVRLLGATALSQKGKGYRSDAGLAGRLVTAAQNERSKVVTPNLGRAVGSIDLATTGQADSVKKMLENGTSQDMREALASGTLFNNRRVPGMYELFVKLARSDANPKVRKAAAAAFWTGTPEGKGEEACKLWLELAGDRDSDLAGHSAYHCAFSSLGGGCTGQWNALLSLIEGQARGGTVKSSFTAAAIRYLYEQKKATAAQKSKALEVAKQLVRNSSNDGAARGTALEFVGKNDPSGKAFAAQYENDSEFFVKNAAKRVREGK